MERSEVDHFDISGDGDNFGFTLMHPLQRTRRQNLIVGVGYDRTITRQINNTIGCKAKGDVGVMTLIALFNRFHADNSFTSVAAVFSTNFNDNDLVDLRGVPVADVCQALLPVRPEKNAQPAKLRIDVSHYRFLTDLWTVVGRATAVGSLDQLNDTERFRLGGQENVRAYPSAEIAGDNGYFLSLEVRRRFKLGSIASPQAKLFVDTGTVYRKHSNLFGVARSESVSGVGIGLITDVAKNYQINLEVVKPIGSQNATDDRDVRGWVGLSANF